MIELSFYIIYFKQDWILKKKLYPPKYDEIDHFSVVNCIYFGSLTADQTK